MSRARMTKVHLTPLVDLKLLAHCELSMNPTITTYTFKDGMEKRRPASPYRALLASFDRLAEAAEAAGSTLAAAFRSAVGGDTHAS